MKKKNTSLLLLLMFMIGGVSLNAQVRGNAEQHLKTQTDRFQNTTYNPAQLPGARQLFQQQGNHFILESHVKINVTPDLLVVHFAAQEQAETVDAAMQQLDSRIDKFTAALQKTGIKRSDIVIDFIQSQRVYGYDDPGNSNILKERLAGFEVKKNVIFRLEDPSKFEDCLRAAAAAEIFDLIKVDYVVNDRQKYQEQAMDLALAALNRKKELVAKLTGKEALVGREMMEVINNEVQPLHAYRQYTAASTQTVDHAHLTAYYRQRNFQILHAHKPSTWYYDAQDDARFDHIESAHTGKPSVQILVFIKAKYLGI